MLIEIVRKTITEEKQVVDLSFPAYFKEEGYTYAVVDESNIIRVSKYGLQNLGSFEFKKVVAMDPATESEFIAAYTSARILTKFFLPPVNIDSNDTGSIDSIFDLP